MKQLSNTDYTIARRLLRHLAERKGGDIRECNASRQAQLLLRKWAKKETI